MLKNDPGRYQAFMAKDARFDERFLCWRFYIGYIRPSYVPGKVA